MVAITHTTRTVAWTNHARPSQGMHPAILAGSCPLLSAVFVMQAWGARFGFAVPNQCSDAVCVVVWGGCVHHTPQTHSMWVKGWVVVGAKLSRDGSRRLVPCACLVDGVNIVVHVGGRPPSSTRPKESLRHITLAHAKNHISFLVRSFTRASVGGPSAH